MHLSAWGLVSTHGAGAAPFFQALCHGQNLPTEASGRSCPVPASGNSTLAFYAGDPGESVRELLVARLLRAWTEANVPASVRENCALIFASTKGCAEDYVWKSDGQGEDPFTPVVEGFLARTALRPREWITVSNACASSHAAVHLARSWLSSGVAQNVVVLAADYVGPFVLQGFHSLKALSASGMVRPFGVDRDGLLLGEAAAVVVFSSEGPLLISGTGLDCEGHAATRPHASGASLRRAVAAALKLNGREVCGVIAHGTATAANDPAENAALAELPGSPLVTATKWSVGHCLGASGLVDLIAAAEWLRAQQPFHLATTTTPDPAFSLRFALPGAPLPAQAWRRILVTALGFGGVHSAFVLEQA